MEAQEDERSVWPDALAAAGIHPPQMQDVAEAAAGDLGQGVAASLATHDALRADLLQGICLFQLASRRSYDGTDPDAAAAHQIVSLLRSRVLKFTSEVRCLLTATKDTFACANCIVWVQSLTHMSTGLDSICSLMLSLFCIGSRTTASGSWNR